MTTDLTERPPSVMTAAPDGDAMLAAVLSDPQRLASVPIETLERLIALRERMQAEAARRAYFDALADFQRACPSVSRRRGVNDRSGRLMYRFAPLEDIVAAIQPIMHQCGLSHRFEPAPDERGGVSVTCIITHRDGHSERTSVHMPATKGINTSAAQDQGIILKYGMRYALTGALGIVTADPDMDGRPPGQAEETITEGQAADLDALIEEVGADRARFLAWAGVESLAELPAGRYRQAVSLLERRREAG